MRLFISSLFAVIVSLNVTGCLINSVREYTPQQSKLSDGESVLLLSIRNVKQEGQDRGPFSVVLNEYDLAQGKITGNCWRNNQVSAVHDAQSEDVRFYAYRVPAGIYVFSGFNTRSLVSDSNAFEAPAGKFVYLGEFERSSANSLRLNGDIEVARNFLTKQWPQHSPSLELAHRKKVVAGPMFLCTP